MLDAGCSTRVQGKLSQKVVVYLLPFSQFIKFD